MSEVLALYDCRSKQEYIYRTNKVKEIAGASALLTDLFKSFFRSTEHGFKFNYDWENMIAPDDYFEYFRNSGCDGEIVYEGGGNLCVIFRDEKKHQDVNKALSLHVLKSTYSVGLVASAVKIEKIDDKYSFVKDRENLYIENSIKKNLGSYYSACNVLPFTLTDRLTHQPIICKKGENQYTAESKLKMKKYEELYDTSKKAIETEAVIETEFDKMVDKGNESLLAIIYIDGNSMGEKLKNMTRGADSYASGINALREFSKKTNEDFVISPINAIQNKLYSKYKENIESPIRNRFLYRPIISGGDEITLVCNARAVPLILETYFDTLKQSGENTACAGVAIFHSHAPFSDVYEIAEQCCESGKRKAHKEQSQNKNFIDFHYCHSGIINSLDAIRERQEAAYTNRPYEYSTSWKEFQQLGIRIAEEEMKLDRSNLKELSRAMTEGNSYYQEELKRIASRQKSEEFKKTIINGGSEIMKMLYDISIVYDLWFMKEGE
ncbi:Cas10/Cmr2 second palm domain-containing protein [Ruminococcus flavefaciens]|uniref:Cas10/Cmr2 second palm domain-containing protein n=1 Tax=Ruminococcus flavefaciens TaxID=1265 RepID=UPI000464C18C|nr:hypothetical protein [Ruminococcus flavefaciens]